MFKFIRQVVSQDRQRYVDSSLSVDLDLTYITPRVIAMGFPASGIEGVYRNHIDDVALVLKKNHPGSYMIWNLSNRDYDYSKLDDQVMVFGFPDHHAPPLNLMFKILLSMHSWLAADQSNVAVVHCMAGKGRTGTIIAAYLCLSMLSSPSDALTLFASQRSRKARGVEQPSQARYVGYFASVLHDRVYPRPVPLLLMRLVMHSIPPVEDERAGACRPVIKIFDCRSYPKTLLWCSLGPTTSSPSSAHHGAKQPLALHNARWYTRKDGAAMWDVPTLQLQGDVLLKCYHFGTNGAKSNMFRFTFHTAFVPSGVLEVRANQLDEAFKDSRYKQMYTDDFFMHLFFEASAEPIPESAGDNADADTYYKLFEASRRTYATETMPSSIGADEHTSTTQEKDISTKIGDPDKRDDLVDSGSGSEEDQDSEIKGDPLGATTLSP
eukprot:TRINITY_DN6758_c0_g1_i4.p1 TRINITY_DN6758_c0_g1~~TRINITY_DN6758_c0_g1_i4.p1  ORF type:complete len:437 (+),score=111.09 TRINITY_DN6758_c0_g1_i4:102-1412(+)